MNRAQGRPAIPLVLPMLRNRTYVWRLWENAGEYQAVFLNNKIMHGGANVVFRSNDGQ